MAPGEIARVLPPRQHAVEPILTFPLSSPGRKIVTSVRTAIRFTAMPGWTCIDRCWKILSRRPLEYSVSAFCPSRGQRYPCRRSLYRLDFQTYFSEHRAHLCVHIASAPPAVVKTFEAGDVQSTLRTISATGKPARTIDAGIRGVMLLANRSSSRARVLPFIGQPNYNGSESSLGSLRGEVEKQNVAVYALTLPEFGKSFMSDTFSLKGVSKSEGGGSCRRSSP